ncbi:aminodeoxychorismate synthase component I [Pseudacidovorax sp. RU35E]|uniref:aminodeoxychorismate synthase component I n=1 Tax=Pseudacidovorax sp. RU35E TaxID=1907403 RepID=UPI000955FAB2|nr:aminodeoxychorismate synthase component I [Pseudacidovorax sp. RU35E]SIR71344.1 para-aminobenzoate synthetase [Pseudacidovorax sp. RU35E]
MRTLLIDNHDSFTYNLFQYLAASNGVPPVVVRNDEMDWAEASHLGFDNIVISPGPGRPQQPADLGLSAQALAQADVPILGVCLGHQAMGHACGATVDLAMRPMHGRIDRISHCGRGLFQGIPDRFEAVRYHSLAVTQLPSSLEALAWAPDGTLMALRHVRKPWWGVQFHPESVCTEHGARLLRNFRELTLEWQQSRVRRSTWGSFITMPEAAEPPAPAWDVRARCLDFFVDPARVYQALFASQRPAFWLDSSQNGPGIARFSFMGDGSGPQSEYLSYDSESGALHVQHADCEETLPQSVFDYLGLRLANEPAQLHAPLPFDFVGGFVGYFGYELKQELDGDGVHEAPGPDAAWLFVDRFLAFDHAEGQVWIVWLTPQGGQDLHQGWVESIAAYLQAEAEAMPPPPPESRTQAASQVQRMRWHTPLPTYRTLIERCQQEIRMGESYELCLTNQLVGVGRVDAMALYHMLRSRNAAPYAAYLALPELSVLSASPELFLAILPDRTVESKPIKGTAPRGNTPEEDERIAQDLLSDEKTRSENLMIVDLLRNDLNRSCEVGSVHVPVLFGIERFATVTQMVSTVRGRLRSDLTAVDAVQAAFPGGSMTGAPKRRTMRIIDALEGAPRGVYSGSLGYLSLNGAARLNIVIRTLVVQDDMLSIGAGGAIVALSDPDAEVNEIVLKARALWDTLKACGAALDDADLQGIAPAAPPVSPGDGQAREN